jgi:hypothetical protein
MLHNKASEGLVKADRLGYDLYSGIAETKALFLKYCKPFEKRIRSLVPTHRVVPAGDGEASTTVSVPGFLVDAKAKKKTPQQVELQFLEHHKTLYLDLHREFTKSEYAPQSEASLQNFKTLLMLEIAILMGCDLEWASGGSVGAALADPPVLAAGAAADDDDASHSEGSDVPGRAEHGARAPAPAEPNDGDDTNDAGGSGADAGGCGADAGGGGGADAGGGGGGADAGVGGGAVAAAEGGIVLDLDQFTTWQPDTWQFLDFDKIQFPTDPMRSICSVRSYFAVAMIFFYEHETREKHTRTWDALSAAWKATFHQDLSSRALEKWPQDGPHGFNDAESEWLTGTLRYLKRGPGRPASTRQRVVPAAAGKAAAIPPPPPRRDSSKAQRRQDASPKPRDTDPVRSASRFLFYT